MSVLERCWEEQEITPTADETREELGVISLFVRLLPHAECSLLAGISPGLEMAAEGALGDAFYLSVYSVFVFKIGALMQMNLMKKLII